MCLTPEYQAKDMRKVRKCDICDMRQEPRDRERLTVDKVMSVSTTQNLVLLLAKGESFNVLWDKECANALRESESESRTRWDWRVENKKQR